MRREVYARPEFIQMELPIIKRTSEQLHGEDQQQVNCITLKAGMKRKARDTHDSTHHIIGEALEIVTIPSVIKLPKLESLKRTVRRERQTIDAAPVQPDSLQELIISPEYQTTAKGKNFLLYDSGPAQRILILGTLCNVKMLNASLIWLADGTFKPLLLSFLKCLQCTHFVVAQILLKMDTFYRAYLFFFIIRLN